MKTITSQVKAYCPCCHAVIIFTKETGFVVHKYYTATERLAFEDAKKTHESERRNEPTEK